MPVCAWKGCVPSFMSLGTPCLLTLKMVLEHFKVKNNLTLYNFRAPSSWGGLCAVRVDLKVPLPDRMSDSTPLRMMFCFS